MISPRHPLAALPWSYLGAMESIHLRHPGGTPEDEADAVNAPRPTHLAANVAAALNEPHAHDALPSNLVSRTAAAAAAGAAAGAALTRRDDAEAEAELRAAAAPLRALQLRRDGLSPQLAALCAFAAAVSMLLHAGEMQDAAGTWLLQTLHFLWIAHREAPLVAAAWVLATCFFGTAVAARCADELMA